MRAEIDARDFLPADGGAGLLVGRVWSPGDTPGPAVVAIGPDGVTDVTHRVPPNHLWSGGDMISTVSDLTRWTRALFVGEVVGPALTEALRTELVPGVFHDSSMSHHGLGVMVFEHGGRRLFGHRGSTPGFFGIVGYDPGEDLAVAVQTNSFASDSASVFRAEVETILFEAARVAEPAAVKPAPG